MNIFFDIIIFGFLLIDVPLIIWLLNKKKDKISPPLRKLIVFLAVITWGVIFYGSFIEPQKIVIQNERVEIGTSGKTMRAAILSDFHVGPYKGERYMNKVVNQVLEQNPDIVLIIGDYIFGKEKDVEKLNPLQRLTKEITTYGVMGNHDYHLSGPNDDIDDELAKAVREKLTEVGVILMEDESRPLDSVQLWITGSQEIWTQRADLDKALSNRSNKELPTILLAHNPDIIEEIQVEQHIDLVLSGHTHGGQIRLPGLGPIGIIPNNLGQSFDQGFFEFEQAKLFITSGLGESGPRARLFNPPEIIMMDISY